MLRKSLLKMSRRKERSFTTGTEEGSMAHSILYSTQDSSDYSPSKEFPLEMGVAYSLELFLQLIPNLFCQVFNNAETHGYLTKIQSAALDMKLICFIMMEYYGKKSFQ